MVTGILEIVAAIKLRKLINNEWLLVLAGIASVAFGVVLLLQPAAGALVLIWWVGAYALLFGILLVVLAFRMRDRKSTRLNSSHVSISYAVFCLKKKNTIIEIVSL